LSPGRALDVGAGEGRNAVWLAERGWKVTAVDFSEVGIAKARRVAEARDVDVNWVLADLREYEPEAAVYDLAIVLYLHLPATDRRLVHRRVAQALRDGGTLLVVGHDSTNLTNGHGGPQDPALLFSPGDIVGDVVGIDGLSVVRAERVKRSVSTESGEQTAVDSLVRMIRQA
jgi:SAM-dependent methyltransferase